MKVSLKKFTRDPYKYSKKAPIIILLGDHPAYALIPYTAYQEHFVLEVQKNDKEIKEAHPTPIQIITDSTPRHWLKRLLFD